jgi:hypothetical protein
MVKLDYLKQLKPDTIFARGKFVDSPEGVNLAGTGRKLRWVAVRGGIHDWAIYAEPPYSDPDEECNGGWTDQQIRRHGTKVHRDSNILALVPCDDEAFAMYRH